MATIRIPHQQIAFYKPHERPLISAKLKDISLRYGNFINQASNLLGVPYNLILSFIFIESAGNPNAISPANAIGLMQLMPSSASDMIILQKNEGFLTDKQKAYMRNFLGARLDCSLKAKYLGHKLPCNNNTGINITKQDLLNPAFNIFLGTLYLAVLLRKHNENGLIRLDKIVVRYNRGYFTKIKGTLEELLATGPLETKDYIAKLIGKNSPLDILTA